MEINAEYWQVIDKDGKEVTPRIYSNGIHQDQMVESIFYKLDEVKKLVRSKGQEGPAICLHKGGAGSGKSLTALNLARFFKKSVIITPTKNSARQYTYSYSGPKSLFTVLRENGTPLVIGEIRGRNNYICQFHSKKGDIPLRADNDTLVCTRELKKEETRRVVGSECPFWNPIYQKKINADSGYTVDGVQDYMPSPFDQSDAGIEPIPPGERIEYTNIYQQDRVYFKRGNGCGYYDQFQQMIDCDVLVMNSFMFTSQLLTGNMPQADLLVIDEFDHWLDGLRINKVWDFDAIDKIIQDRKIDLDNLRSKDKIFLKLGELNQKFRQYSMSFPLDNFGVGEEFEVSKDEFVKEIIDFISQEKLKYVTELKSLHHLGQQLKASVDNLFFTPFLKKEKRKRDKKEEKVPKVKFFVLDLEAEVKRIFSLFPFILCMSATFHNRKVLSETFGIKDEQYGNEIIWGERSLQGELRLWRGNFNSKYVMPTNSKVLEMGKPSRIEYLKRFDLLLLECEKHSDQGKFQTLVHLPAYNVLPSKYEGYMSVILPQQEDLRMRIWKDKNGDMLIAFKSGEKWIYFSTKDGRAADLPDKECRCIFIPKRPFDDFGDPFYKAMRKKNNTKFNLYYNDRMEREFEQMVARGLRGPDDWVYIMSPDSNVLDMVQRLDAKIRFTETIETGD